MIPLSDSANFRHGAPRDLSVTAELLVKLIVTSLRFPLLEFLHKNYKQYTVRKNWTLFSFEHKFGTWDCPILIIFALLQNYDQVYPEIYHLSTNLLLHYSVK